jgi:hypothetical protein
MTLCPIALAVGCQKCPAFRICPLTTVLGMFRAWSPGLREAVAAPCRSGQDSRAEDEESGQSRPKRRRK